MKITPLVALAAMRVPALTSTFSDPLAVTSMEVVASDVVTLTCASPHGLAAGEQRGLCVVDALIPNPITDLEETASGDIIVTTQYAHDLTTSPDETWAEGWDAFAIIAGTGVAGLDGSRQLVSVDTPVSFTVRPPAPVTLPGSIPEVSRHLARLERQVTGWHVATATSTTEMTFPTPAAVTRDYTVEQPSIVTNIRVWGAVDLEHALGHFTRDDEDDAPVPGRGYLFVCPLPQTRLSRDPRSTSDATAELMPTQFIRQRLLDGFEVYAVLPAEKSGGGVACMDKAHGEILRAVMRTFNGLRMPYTEFAFPDPFVSIMTSHGAARFTKANYVHQYTFESGVVITNADCADSVDLPDLTLFDQALTSGETPTPGSVQPIGTVPFLGLDFGPDPQFGIWNKDHPSPLTVIIPLPPED